MSVFSVAIRQVVTNGPYAYYIAKDGVGQKDANNQTSIGTALDNVKADIQGLLGGQTISGVTMNVSAA